MRGNPSWAKGVCDVCGFTRPLNELQAQIYDQRPTGLKVCDECLDEDNPQLQVGCVPVDDQQSLNDPRPDVNERPSTTYFGWAPVGNPVTHTITVTLGSVTVSG